MKKEKIPVKIVSKEQSAWEEVKREAKILLDQSEKNIIIQKGMLEFAEQKIRELEAKGDQ